VGGRLWLAVAAGSCGVWLGCNASGAFACETNSQCGDGGLCQSTGYCSFDDDECESGQAYGGAAPPGVAGKCVPVDDAETAGGDTTGPQPVSTGDGEGDATTTGGDVDDSSGGDTLALTSGASTSAAESSTGPELGDSSGDDDGSSSGEPIARVTDGLLVLYEFTIGSGDIVEDLSGTDPAMPLSVQPVGGSPSWVAGGLHFDGGGIAAVQGSSSKVRLGLQATNTLSVEAWVTPSELSQEGPSRIVTFSLDSTERSFTLGHGGVTENPDTMLGFGESFVARLQTTDSMGTNGTPGLVTESLVELEPMHVVMTHDEDSEFSVWVDGELVASEARTGTFDNWSTEHVLGVGNEISLNRPYFGTVHLVAVYDRALSQSEIQQNHAAGY